MAGCNHDHHNVHDHIGPVMNQETATLFEVHGTPTELDMVLTGLDTITEIVTARRHACTDTGAHNCQWLEVVVIGPVTSLDFFASYQAATAARN
jgi:hypothetical protein